MCESLADVCTHASCLPGHVGVCNVYHVNRIYSRPSFPNDATADEHPPQAEASRLPPPRGNAMRQNAKTQDGRPPPGSTTLSNMVARRNTQRRPMRRDFPPEFAVKRQEPTRARNVATPAQQERGRIKRTIRHQSNERVSIACRRCSSVADAAHSTNAADRSDARQIRPLLDGTILRKERRA